LTPDYEQWARQRIESGAAEGLTIDQISATEWPLFGSVFYLWATESLQEAWEDGDRYSATAPREYARGAIEAAAEIIADPGHATWVKQHWGDNYLDRQNLFYRELLIAGLTSHYKLTGDDRYVSLLREQVAGLSREVDESPCGLLEDYPGECYPTDVLGAIAAIKRADVVLGTDHSDFLNRAVRGFSGETLDKNGLPPYNAIASEGATIQPARGCGLSFMLIVAPEVWEDKALEWYGLWEDLYWQEGFAAGFREFARGSNCPEWYADVDSGPVMWGYGTAASAFGLGAARANGRFDHAYPLGAEMLVAVWTLPDGRLLLPRMLSNMGDAPLLGEAAILFSMTRQPADGLPEIRGGRIPSVVYAAVSAYFLIGAALVLTQLAVLKRWRRRRHQYSLPLAMVQVPVWVVVTACGIVVFLLGGLGRGVILLLIAQLLPRTIRKQRVDVKEEQPEV
jgi:hypothetical protein